MPVRLARGDWQARDKPGYASAMEQPLRVDPVGVQLMANRWGTSASELNGTVVPTGSGLSCQASAVAVNAAHGDIAAFTRVLATRVGTRATHVTEADVRYVAQEADSANQLAAVADPATGV
jgi:hypothetical protein